MALPPNSRVTGAAYLYACHFRHEDSNSAPWACTATILPSEPSPGFSTLSVIVLSSGPFKTQMDQGGGEGVFILRRKLL